MARFVILHRIYEGANREPVVEHRFYGRTPEQAERIYRAHRSTDSFLRGCDDNRRFGKIQCRSEVERRKIP